MTRAHAGDRAIAWKINSEVVLLLGWGRAILLQIAHPMVAAGVAEHSVFASHPELRLYRFYCTLEAMLHLMFGTPEEASSTARSILAIHDRVNGQLRMNAGVFPAGSAYSAHDPELLKWVHVTLVDSFLLTFETFIGPLRMSEKDAYCREASRLTTLLGVSEQSLPQSHAEMRSYFNAMLHSGHLAVAADAQSLAIGVLSPPVPVLLWPAKRLMRSVTVGLLPVSIQRQYGLVLSPREQLAFERLAAVTRLIAPLLPARLRRWPKSVTPSSTVRPRIK